jgi:hypothetical protein
MDRKLHDGKIYRDDRVFVMRVASNFTKEADGSVTVALSAEPEIDPNSPVVLVTYRNLPSLPAFRVDNFPSLSAAIAYIKRVEPTGPRVSLGGRSPEPTPPWQEHLEWLHGQGLQSAAEGDAPLPHWVDGKNNPRETFIIGPKK